MKNILLLTLLLSILSDTFSQKCENIILITLDGLRWQEVYGGAVDSLMENKDLTKYRDQVYNKFHHDNKDSARALLLPFFWKTIAKEGQLYGNQWDGNEMYCSNRFWFSYPGYNEILSGYSDPRINSNKKEYNPNVTVLEWLNNQPEFYGKVAAFGSWDVFPYIINDERSGIPVNAGFRKAEGNDLTLREKFLNEFQDEISGPWNSVRLDAFTHHYMMEHMRKEHPKVVYISYGETDDFAHDGRYDFYLESAHKTDQWIAELWNFIQSDKFYKDKTAIVITTDHGRGDNPMTEWKSHGTIFKGSNAIWAAALGPKIEPLGIITDDKKRFQNQIAQTVAQLLGFEYTSETYQPGSAIENVVK